MDDHGASLIGMVLDDPLAEAEEGRGVLGHAVVGPHQEVELSHLTHWHLGLALPSNLRKKEQEKDGIIQPVNLTGF